MHKFTLFFYLGIFCLIYQSVVLCLTLVKVKNEFIKDVLNLSHGFFLDMLAFSKKKFVLIHSYNPDITFHLTQIPDSFLSKDSKKVLSYLHIDVRAASLK